MRFNSYIYGILSAGVFTLASLSSCSTEESELDTLWQSGEKVFTQISVSVPAKSSTRMSESVVQKDNDFLGMQEIYLIPFYKAGTDDVDPIKSTDSRVGDRINLPAVGSDAANTIGSTSLYANNNSKLYTDVQVSVGINAFLVYGSAMPSGATADNAVDGKLNASGLDGNPSDISFSLQPIRVSDEVVSEAQALANYLNTIYDADTWAANTILKGFQSQVESMKAGSAASVVAFAKELYEALDFAKSDAGVAAVRALILNGETDIDDLDLGDYPTDIPAGAAVVEFSGGQFAVVTNMNNLGAMSVDITAFTYPAQLWYRSNSRINTAPESKAAKYEDTETNDTWTKVLATYETEHGIVEQQTKSIAIRNQLNYAVARFDLSVVMPAGATVLKDFEGHEVDLDDLEMTGILVGQQKDVDFVFQPSGTNSYTIYDNQLTSTVIGATSPNYTLVLETAATTVVNVAVELLNNGEQTIVTKSGEIIPKGCKFYLIGKLDPATVAAEDKPGDWGTSGVFKQDHNTAVTFTLRADKVDDETLSSLANAYYVLPDLSGDMLDISLGVIDWKLSTPKAVELDKE